MGEPLHMWGYWRDKEGGLDAVRDHYPDRLAASDELARAVGQVETGLRAIDDIMNKMDEGEE